MPRHERQIAHIAHGVEASPHWQPQCKRRVRVDVAEPARQVVAPLVVVVDPVPGEIAEGHRRHAGGPRGGDAKRRQIRDHHLRIHGTQKPGFAVDARVEAAHEFSSAGNRGRGIEPQAVDLHHAGVGLNRRQLDGGMRGARKQPGRHLRSHDHP
jgi:hypothetical protein